MEHIEKLLWGLPLFTSFTPTELRGLIEKSQLKTFEPHEIIIEFGQPGKFLGVILDGEAEVTIANKTFYLKKGDFVIMPANQPHSLRAIRRFKMILTMIKS